MVATLRRRRTGRNHRAGELRRPRNVESRIHKTSRKVIRVGIRGRARGATLAAVSSPPMAERPFATRLTPGALVDVAIVAVALAGSLAQLSHGGIAGSRTGPEELD